MKKEFYGFYEPSEVEIDKSWNNSYFVFDANTLLNLYRYSESTRKDFLMVITKLKENLFMPYQVGYEYHSNRHGVIENLEKSYDNLLSTIKENCDKILTSTINQYLRHPSISADNLKKTLDDFLKKFNTELERQKKNHPDFKTNDEVLQQLTELYENKVGPQFSATDLQKIFIEGKNRYDQQIPPGYKDLEPKKKKGEIHIYGDFIIWKEIIALAKKDKKEIIFITDDRKEDWWTIENGKTIRPREELIKEFYDLTGVRILIYNADSFLHFAKERKLVSKIKEQSISEVKEVRKADENDIRLNDYLISSQLYNSTDTISDLFKNTSDLTQWGNPDDSTISELLKNTSGLTSWGNSIGSALSKLQKNTETVPQILTPLGLAMSEKLKNTSGLTSWENTAGSALAKLQKNTEGITKTLTPIGLEISDKPKDFTQLDTRIVNNLKINKEEPKLMVENLSEGNIDNKVIIESVKRVNDLKRESKKKK